MSIAELPHEFAQLDGALRMAEAEAAVTLAYVRESKVDPRVKATVSRMTKRLRDYADALEKELK
jgi:hypothetical protein